LRVRLCVCMLFFVATAYGLYWLSHMPESTTAGLLAAINHFTDPPGRQAAFDDPRAVERLDSDDSYDLTLAQAIDQRLLDVSFQGMDLMTVLADVRRLPDRPLRLAIMPGTLLTPEDADGRYQDVVVREKRVLQIPAKGTAVGFRIPVLALSMTREVPTGVALRPGNAAADKAVLTLLATPRFAQMRPALQQYAVWTLTDNPAFNEFVGIYSGSGRGQPNRQDVSALAQVFRDAGLDTTKYKVFTSVGAPRGAGVASGAGVSPASGRGMGVSPMRPEGVSPSVLDRKDHGQDAHETHDQDGHATDEIPVGDSPANPSVAADGDPTPPSADGPAIILIRNGKTTVVPRK